MWPLTIVLGFVIAYFILKFTDTQTSTTYLPGKSYYKSGPKVNPSPLPVDEALIGVGLETRVEPSKSVMDSGSPVAMVMMNPSPMPPMPPMSPMPPMPPTSPMNPAPSPMMAMGNAPVVMTPVPAPFPSV